MQNVFAQVFVNLDATDPTLAQPVLTLFKLTLHFFTGVGAFFEDLVVVGEWDVRRILVDGGYPPVADEDAAERCL
jgi:hypothetical protein